MLRETTFPFPLADHVRPDRAQQRMIHRSFHITYTV